MFTETAPFYDAIYSFKDYRAESQQVAALIRRSRPEARRVLDVACGTGEHARWLVDDWGFLVEGIDLDTGLLALARQKVPTGRFERADMEAFTLDHQFDAVVCLFSAIAYLVTIERVANAIECFRRHVEPGGLLLVEPWFAPGVIDPARVSRLRAELPQGHVERVSQIEVAGRVSRIHFRYKITTDAGSWETSEIHELGLFTVDEMQMAFKRAGLTAAFEPSGLAGRGLWVATNAA